MILFAEQNGATPIDPNEMAGLRFKHVTTREQLNELEQANIEDGLLWLNRRRKRDILDDTFLRDLHKRLFGKVWSWAGTYRSTEKTIGVAPEQIAVQTWMLLGDASYWTAHATYPPLEAAARFHHRLVQIHLFANGKGRHARIATDVLLQDYFGLAPIVWADGFDFVADKLRRGEYIAALREADKGEFGLLLRFVGSG